MSALLLLRSQIGPLWVYCQENSELRDKCQKSCDLLLGLDQIILLLYWSLVLSSPGLSCEAVTTCAATALFLSHVAGRGVGLLPPFWRKWGSFLSRWEILTALLTVSVFVGGWGQLFHSFTACAVSQLYMFRIIPGQKEISGCTYLGLLPTKYRQIHREVYLGGSTVE